MKGSFFTTIITACLLTTAANAQQSAGNGNTGNNDDFLVRKTQARVSYYSKKFSLDTALSNQLFNHFYSRETELNRIYQKYAGTGQLDDQLLRSTTWYDSIENNLLHAARATAFLKNRIAGLNRIRPLPASQQTGLQHMFLKLCNQSADNSYADNFNKAMHTVISDTLYYGHLYRTDIMVEAMSNAKKALTDLVKKYRLSREMNETLFPILNEREKALTTLNYAMPAFTKQKDSLVSRVRGASDSLLAIALMKDGIFSNDTRFSFAMKNRKLLGLNDTQVDQLMKEAFELDKVFEDYHTKYPLKKYNARSYEAERLPPILSEDQYMQLLTFIYKPQAEEWAKGDWLQLDQMGLAKELNRDLVIRQITQYNANRLAIKERYVNDPATMNHLVKGIDKSPPEALKILRAALAKERRQEQGEPQTTKTTNQSTAIKGSFQW